MVTLFQGNDLKIKDIEINERLFEVVVEETQPGKSYRIDVSLRREDLPKGRINEFAKPTTGLYRRGTRREPISSLAWQKKLSCKLSGRDQTGLNLTFIWVGRILSKKRMPRPLRFIERHWTGRLNRKRPTFSWHRPWKWLGIMREQLTF